MTLQQLEYVIALDSCRHFVTAAEQCFVTQPTLTMPGNTLVFDFAGLLWLLVVKN